jgi:diaminopropionate ammonia-lyase
VVIEPVELSPVAPPLGGLAAEGAEVVIVDGSYEDALEAAARAGEAGGTAVIADVGDHGPAEWVIDGYATLFAEAAAQASYDLILVPVGVGSLAAAAARHGARAGVAVVGVEPVTAACLTASLRAGEPTRVPTPGTTMAGLDCAEVSPSAWPSLRAGIHATVTVTDEETDRAVRDLRCAGLRIGESGAAPLAALRALAADRHPILPSAGRVLLIATEGPTGTAA